MVTWVLSEFNQPCKGSLRKRRVSTGKRTATTLLIWLVVFVISNLCTRGNKQILAVWLFLILLFLYGLLRNLLHLPSTLSSSFSSCFSSSAYPPPLVVLPVLITIAQVNDSTTLSLYPILTQNLIVCQLIFVSQF